MQLKILIGLPGSGKSTWLEGFRAEKHPYGDLEVFSPDDYLYDVDGDYVWTEERAARAWRETYKDFGYWLADGEGTAVFDACMLSARDRAALVSIVKGFNTNRRGGHIEAVYIGTDLETCIARNAARPRDRAVPEETLRRMARKLEVPTKEEGFDAVTILLPSLLPAGVAA